MIRIAAMFLLSLTVLSAHASQTVSATCAAYGKTDVGGNDTGAFVSDSLLKLRLEKSADATVTAVIDGKIKVIWAWDAQNVEPKDIKDEDAYTGIFKLGPVANNPKYRPKKYKAYIQFKDIDATESIGLESGMWGELVIAPGAFANAPFHAAYIFKAGDHMGGTLHFNCTVN